MYINSFIPVEQIQQLFYNLEESIFHKRLKPNLNWVLLQMKGKITEWNV